MNHAYLYVLFSTTCFSLATLFFTELSRKASPLWMNTFKAVIALFCFGVATLLFESHPQVSTRVFLALFVSGLIGLGIGDIFLFMAFARMGSARTLVIYGFQPLFVGLGAHFLFHQELTAPKGLAILFFLGCLALFSVEKFRKTGHWEVAGLAAALLGVILDNFGVLLTRWAFDHAPELRGFEANFIRCAGACLFFLLAAPFLKFKLWPVFKKLKLKFKALAIFSSMLGTFFSLYFYLKAIKSGHLATVASIVAAAPILSAVMESAYERKLPSRYLLAALLLFVLGFLVLAGF